MAPEGLAWPTQDTIECCVQCLTHDSYAGASQELSDAIFDSVLPRRAGDMLPHTQPGLLAAFADRLDSIVGLIAAGCAPSSQADPFGVRRDAYALLQVSESSGVGVGEVHWLRYCRWSGVVFLSPDTHCQRICRSGLSR